MKNKMIAICCPKCHKPIGDTCCCKQIQKLISLLEQTEKEEFEKGQASEYWAGFRWAKELLKFKLKNL